MMRSHAGNKNSKKLYYDESSNKIESMSQELLTRKYLAFDIETAKILNGDFSLWRQHRPLGIACAATCASDGEPRLWYSKNTDGTFAKRLTIDVAKHLVAYLLNMKSLGYTLLTWNGAAFDFDVLAEEADAFEDCRACVHDHVDMMFHLVCLMGRGVKLAKAAEGLGLPGKTEGISGADVPQRWADGDYENVLRYVAQDVRLPLQIAAECDRREEFCWISSDGTRKIIPLLGGWKTVREALALPLPEITGLTRAISRDDCLAWMR